MAASVASHMRLSNNSDFYRRLLVESNRWRRRLEINLLCTSATHVQVTSNYLIDFHESVFDGYLDPQAVERIDVLLPLTTRTKAPLINPGFSGPFGPAHLPLRATGSQLGADYLLSLVRNAGIAAVETGLPNRLLEAICLFSPGPYQPHAEVAPEAKAISRYLAERSGGKLNVSWVWVQRQLAQLDATRQILLEHLGEPRCAWSSSENPLLILPLMPEVAGQEQAERLIGDYREAVRLAHEHEQGPLLAGLAEYGRRYELIVAVELPTIDMATVTFVEDQQIDFPQGWHLDHVFSSGSAASVHLEARIADPAVAIVGKKLFDECDNPVKPAYIEGFGYGSETATFYSSVPDRPAFMRLRLTLRPAVELQAVAFLLGMVNLVACAGLIILNGDGLDPDEIAVLVVPTTLAATFALVREQSTLASALLSRWRAWLGLTVLILWGVAFWALLSAPDATASQTSTSAAGCSLRVHAQGC